MLQAVRVLPYLALYFLKKMVSANPEAFRKVF